MTALLAAAPSVSRAETVACTAPPELIRAGFGLPLLAKSLKEKTPTTILVLNSTASVAKKRAGEAGTEAVPRSFPSFIEETLKARYPDGGVKLVIRNEPRRTAVAGEQRCAIAEFMRVDEMECFRVITCPHHRQHGPENLFLVDSHLRRDPIQQSAAQPETIFIALQFQAAAIDRHFGAFFLALIDIGGDLVAMRFRH